MLDKVINLGQDARPRVVLFGAGAFGREVGKRILYNSGANLLGVVAPEGDACSDWATQMGLWFGPPRIGQDHAKSLLGLDLIVTANWTRHVPDDVLLSPARGVLVGHPSLLPRHRGVDSVRWTVKERDPIAGFTWFAADSGWDTGPIVYQEWCHVDPAWDASALWREALFPLGVRTVGVAIGRAMSGVRFPQVERFATQAPKLELDPT